MDKKEKWLSVLCWPLIGGISVLVLLAMFFDFSQLAVTKKFLPPSSPPKETEAEAKEAILILDYNNGKVRRFRGPVEQSANLWDIFQEVIAAGDIKLETKDNLIPESIDG
ncbi:MAG: hypothetical protein ACPLZH_02550, partial [Minisyncoccales bacterium]